MTLSKHDTSDPVPLIEDDLAYAAELASHDTADANAALMFTLTKKGIDKKRMQYNSGWDVFPKPRSRG